MRWVILVVFVVVRVVSVVFVLIVVVVGEPMRWEPRSSRRGELSHMRGNR